MSVIATQILKTLPAGMFIPQPLERLFDWIEDSGYFTDNELGRHGFLYPLSKLNAGWSESERPGGTIVEFLAEGNVHLKQWFGEEYAHLARRLYVFCKTGGDGSSAAFWIDDYGRQRIVHLGSGSGSVLVCVLADDPIDFLRLLAIGYDELCWNEDFSHPPNQGPDSGAFFVRPNVRFRTWVCDTFDVTIPTTGLEIVKHPAEMGQAASPDDFHSWFVCNSG